MILPGPLSYVAHLLYHILIQIEFTTSIDPEWSNIFDFTSLFQLFDLITLFDIFDPCVS